LTNDLHAKVEALAPREWVIESRGRGVIVADGQRLTQALVQLAANAARHAPGEDPITLGSAVDDGEARFWVADRGPGIAPEERERIFDRFTRASAGLRPDGAGLGLPIVRSIAEAHHGRVEVEMRPGGGSTFTLVPVDQPRQAEER
jgi:signal transduction histidine kinase